MFGVIIHFKALFCIAALQSNKIVAGHIKLTELTNQLEHLLLLYYRFIWYKYDYHNSNA